MTPLQEVLEVINADIYEERNLPNRALDREMDPPKVKDSSSRKNISHVTVCSSKPEDRKHVQIFEKLFALFSTFSKIVGMQMRFDWAPYKNFMFVFVICLMFFTWVCIFYTQYIHIRNGDILRILEPCAIYGVASSCTQKILGHLKKRHHILSLFFSIRKICRQIQDNDNRADVLANDLMRTLRFSKMFTVGVFSCVGLFLASPFRSYIVDRELISLLPLEIVFIDQSTYVGFGMANGVVVVMGLFAALGTILYGAIFIFAVFMYSMQVNLIGQDFKDLDRLWTTDCSTVSLAYKHAFLWNICRKRQDIKEFMDAIRNIFQRKFFFYFCFNYFSQIICLFEVTKNQWLPGYGIALALFIEMMFYCVMGSQITLADERLCSFVYMNEWYRYDIQTQRTLILLLDRSQLFNELQLGPLGPLTVVTEVKVIKSIYTYYTVLTELF